MTTPKVICDAVLGLLIWDDSACSLKGKVQLSPDREIDFWVEFMVRYTDVIHFEDVDFALYLPQIRLQITTLLQSEEKFRLVIADQVLQNYCRKFNINGVDRNKIAQSITLYELALFAQGDMDLYYSVAEELTWWDEHDITVKVREGEVSDVFWL